MSCFKLATSAFLLLLTASAVAAQTTDECEKLKIDNAKLKFENANLKKGIIAHSPATAPVQVTGGISAATQSAPVQSGQQQTVGKVDFALIKCQGNAKAQTVTVTLLVTNRAANQRLQFVSAKAIDDQGDEYPTYDIHIGSGGIGSTITTGIPVKAVFIIPKVLPATKMFRLFSAPVYKFDSGPNGETAIDFRNLTISWK